MGGGVSEVGPAAGSRAGQALRRWRYLLGLICVAPLLALSLVVWVGVRLHLGDAATRNPIAAAVPIGYAISGVDVSDHDHPDGAALDWPARATAGEQFAYVKATEGTFYVNPYFAQDYEAAKAAGLYVGAYAFARPDLGDPRPQARYLIEHMRWKADGRTLPPLIDLEWPYFSGIDDCYGLSPAELTGWISDFIDELQTSLGVRPVLYTNLSWWNPCTGGSAAFAGYPLDISSCSSAPPAAPGWGNDWTFWQYDIPECGRGGAVLADVFHGTAAQLAALASGTAAGPR
jgi:GH25 family lysozyme M1 (1,4-beta-N-acetylmuramidase)